MIEIETWLIFISLGFGGMWALQSVLQKLAEMTPPPPVVQPPPRPVPSWFDADIRRAHGRHRKEI